MSKAILDVCCPAAGLIHEIQVSIATQISNGEEMMSLEAPQQPLSITAPGSGEVIEILVKEGDAVELDQVIARIKQREQR